MWNMRLTMHFHWLSPSLSLLLCRFCACDWTCDLLQDRALHTPVLLLLLGHSCLPAGYNGCSHAHLEHFTSPRWLPCAPGYNHQSLTGITFPPTPRQWLCGVAMLNCVGMKTTLTRLCSNACIHPAIGSSNMTLMRRGHSCGSTIAGLTCTCNCSSLYFTTPPIVNKNVRIILLLSLQKSQI